MSGPSEFEAEAVERSLAYAGLVAGMAAAFDPSVSCPPRLVIEGVARDGSPMRTLVMAAARAGGLTVVKTVFVGGREGVRSHLTAFGRDGRVVATLDGETLTARRTAAASVLAAGILARPDARLLAVLGAGRQALEQARAYLASRPLERVIVWARRPGRAAAMAERLASETHVPISVAPSASMAVRSADLVTVATRSRDPLVLAQDVGAGAHVDLVGGFRPDMREADDALIAGALVVADNAHALAEAGDLAGPLAAGVLSRADVRLFGDVLDTGFDRPEGSVTVYKSVGFAAQDLVAVELLLDRRGDVAGSA